MAKPSKVVEKEAESFVATAEAAEDYTPPPAVDVQRQLMKSRQAAELERAQAELEGRAASTDDIAARIPEDRRPVTTEGEQAAHVDNLDWIKAQMPKHEPRENVVRREALAREDDIALILREMNRG